MSFCGVFCNTGVKRAILIRRRGRNWRIVKICFMFIYYAS